MTLAPAQPGTRARRRGKTRQRRRWVSPCWVVIAVTACGGKLEPEAGNGALNAGIAGYSSAAGGTGGSYASPSGGSTAHDVVASSGGTLGVTSGTGGLSGFGDCYASEYDALRETAFVELMCDNDSMGFGGLGNTVIWYWEGGQRKGDDAAADGCGILDATAPPDAAWTAYPTVPARPLECTSDWPSDILYPPGATGWCTADETASCIVDDHCCYVVAGHFHRD